MAKDLPKPQQQPIEDGQQDGRQQQQNQNVRQVAKESTGARTRSQGLSVSDVEPKQIKRGIRELRNLGIQIGETHTNESAGRTSDTIEEKEGSRSHEGDQANLDHEAPDRAAMAISALAMIDKWDADIGELADDMACLATEENPEDLDPSKYKDVFEKPSSFDEAWNHPDEFQRTKWREAITKEFDKMELNKVWTKVERKKIPEGLSLIHI